MYKCAIRGFPVWKTTNDKTDVNWFLFDFFFAEIKNPFPTSAAGFYFMEKQMAISTDTDIR